MALWNSLDVFLEHLLKPKQLGKFAEATLDSVPLQTKEGDCGLFVCQYAVDFCLGLEFSPLNLVVLRDEANISVECII